ncbi:MAG: excinuclease ABC subunit UvrC [Erysipelotrichaceae bacterium]|nr:excinuclease ABC subunit UvrC [Erysipelotrichaceae bacterium]
MDKDYIKAKLASLPNEPGSYQMKNKDGEIIYVGKAKNLHNRVNQYFTGAHDYKTTKMVSLIDDFDFIVTRTEKEALVLEINLIKKYRPKYNIQFMDDSTYPYIKLTKEDYPRIMVARNIKKDRNARYFGPFPDVYAARTTQKLLQQLYPFRRCAKLPTKVCLYYHLGQCLGPCEHEVDPAVYDRMVSAAARFLNGDTREVVQNLTVKMQEAAENLEFEKAAEYRTMIDSINKVIDRQIIEKGSRENLDVFAWYEDKGYLAVAGFLVRGGAVLNKEFRLEPLYGDGEDEFISFLLQYYQEHPAAGTLVLPQDTDTEVLTELLGLRIVQPQKGYRKQLIDLCMQNARKQLEQKFDTVERQDSVTQEAVDELSRLAGKRMSRVELFDNSHTSGTFTVASCVVYDEGEPNRKEYRLYRLHTANSDLDSMKEVIYRRYFRLLKDGGRIPDAVLVDGGKMQIDAAAEIIDSLGLNDTISVLGLVKDSHHNTNALMNREHDTYDIDKDSGLFFLLARMQDEVHRTAISYHRKLRAKAQTKSILDEVEGIGPKRKKLLLKTFGSFTRLKNATEEEIASVVPVQTAHKVYEALHSEE